MTKLIGKWALVCGGSKGIGLASAKKLAELGLNITILSRNEKSLQKSVKEIPIHFDQQTHNYISVDMSDIDSLKTKITFTGNEYIVLINNSGGPPGGPIASAENNEFEAAFRQHLLVNHTLTQILVEGMKNQNYGRIINIISTSVKQPLPNLGVSNTIRAAVANWSKTMANELAQYNITVNNVLPGATETGRLSSIIGNKASKTSKSVEEVSEGMKSVIPMKRFGKPEEIANAVKFLASPDASYITGINVPVDGGRTSSL